MAGSSLIQSTEVAKRNQNPDAPKAESRPPGSSNPLQKLAHPPGRGAQRYAVGQSERDRHKNTGTLTFKYDPMGRRIEKASPTTTSVFAYDGDNLIETTNSSGILVARYAQTLNIDEPLAELRSSTTSYYEADGLGSITSLTSAAGAVANTYAYDSYGNLTASSGSVSNPFSYTGREFDIETGLYYYRARNYDPSAGRFLSEDPIGLNQGSSNYYSYVINNPIALVDPEGLRIEVRGDANCYEMAKAYLMSAPSTRSVFKTLEDSAQTYYVNVYPDTNPADAVSHNHQAGNQVYWYCHFALRCSNGTSTQSPALGLFHELAHLVGPRSNPVLPDRQYNDNEERRVITGPEARAAKELGEDRRNDHMGTYFFVIHPFDRH